MHKTTPYGRYTQIKLMRKKNYFSGFEIFDRNDNKVVPAAPCRDHRMPDRGWHLVEWHLYYSVQMWNWYCGCCQWSVVWSFHYDSWLAAFQHSRNRGSRSDQSTSAAGTGKQTPHSTWRIHLSESRDMRNTGKDRETALLDAAGLRSRHGGASSLPCCATATERERHLCPITLRRPCAAHLGGSFSDTPRSRRNVWCSRGPTTRPRLHS